MHVVVSYKQVKDITQSVTPKSGGAGYLLIHGHLQEVPAVRKALIGKILLFWMVFAGQHMKVDMHIHIRW